MTTTNLKEVTDDQIEAQLKEIQGKEKKEQDDIDKLTQLREEKSTRFQKRMDKAHYEKKAAQEEAERFKQELEQVKKEREELLLKTRESSKPVIREEATEIGGKKYYNDATLRAMIDANELDEASAYRHQQERMKAEIKQDILNDVKRDEEKNILKRQRDEDYDVVKRDYPQFLDKSHPNHDPNDPLYKKASELFYEGYQNNPKGLSLSIKRAKEMLRINDTNIDVSDDLNVGRSQPTQSRTAQKKDEAILSEEEKEIAIQQFCRGDTVNPATKRAYTENEAIAKATRAKQVRAEKRTK